MQYRYFKYLNLDWQTASKKLAKMSNELSEKAVSIRSNWLDANTKTILEQAPELIEMVKPLNATIRWVAFFVSQGNPGVVHIDSDTFSKCRINIPIQNCDDTETQFFTCSSKPIRITLPNNVVYHRIDREKCTYVDHFKLTQPVLFRNTEPHMVVCNHDRVRISCTISLNEDLEYLLQ
jgi:hypothetical protein